MSRSKEAAFADRPLCNAPTKHGGSCANHAMKNSTRCRSHGGNTPAAIDAARVRALRQADPLMAKLHAIAFNDKMPPQVQLEAIKHALKVTGAFESKQTIQVDVGSTERTFADFVGDAIVDVEEEEDDDPDTVYTQRRALEVVDADVVDPYADPPTNRHDRALAAEVAREKRNAPVGLSRAVAEDIEAAERVLAQRKQSGVAKGREAYLRALDAGATHDQAEAQARRVAEGGEAPEPFRRREFVKRPSTRDE